MLVVVGSPFYAEAERISETVDAERMPETVDAGLDAPLLWWDWTGCLAKIGSLMFAVTFAPSAFHGYSAMETRTVK